jgi:diguanylate cyclase
MMDALVDLIEENQSFLTKRILFYAKIHDYVKYTSTLEEAWVMSIKGLSHALAAAVGLDDAVPEIDVDHDFTNHAISAFGVMEARKHRGRGISLEMFLSFFKYYRQAYLDLVRERVDDVELVFTYQLWVNRYFDHNEIAYIQEWTANTDDVLIAEMQMANMKMTNEKNKYLTIFESTPNPVVILDAEHRCINLNHAAQRLFMEEEKAPGFAYYSGGEHPHVNDLMPWVTKELYDFISGDGIETDMEKEYDSPAQGRRTLSIRFHRMLDVSNKFEGTVMIFNDLTAYKNIEKQLRFMSFHDSLTGLYNRAYLDEELMRLASGRFNPIGFISIDVDGLKLVNDNLGHVVGDSLLLTVGRILRESFRDSDVVARTGGDEFAIIIPQCDLTSMEKACRRLRGNMHKQNEMQSDLPISFSVGWSVGNLQVKSNIPDIIKEADQSMYTDKKRNRSRYLDVFKEWLSNKGKNVQAAPVTGENGQVTESS